MRYVKHIISNHTAHLCFINSNILSVLPFENIYSGNIRSVPGERVRFCPVPGARNCVNLHLFIDFIHYYCNHMAPFVHLKRVNTKNLIYNCNTALKHKNVKTGLATHFTMRENNNRWYLLKYPIFHVEIVSEYILR